MSARAHVVDDWIRNQVRIAVALGQRSDVTQVLKFESVSVVTLQPGVLPPDDHTLDIPEDVARAMYEALADHFGHSGHDTRALRRDYEAERSRVDKLIAHMVRGGAA